MGYAPSRPDALRKFVEAFHDPEWEKERPAAEVQKTFLPEPTPALKGLGQAATALVHQIARRYTAAGQPQPRKLIGGPELFIKLRGEPLEAPRSSL